MSSNFPTIQEILGVHQDQIEPFGGSHEHAGYGTHWSRRFWDPQMGYYDGIIEEAAAMMESLAMNHHFDRRQQAGGPRRLQRYTWVQKAKSSTATAENAYGPSSCAGIDSNSLPCYAELKATA